MIAKYRKDGHPGEWWLSDFTMQQVEGRLEHLEKEKRINYIMLQNLNSIKNKCLQYQNCKNVCDEEVHAFLDNIYSNVQSILDEYEST
jgi:hypothetical protein